jgi:hypothetical protein
MLILFKKRAKSFSKKSLGTTEFYEKCGRRNENDFLKHFLKTNNATYLVVIL